MFLGLIVSKTFNSVYTIYGMNIFTMGYCKLFIFYLFYFIFFLCISFRDSWCAILGLFTICDYDFKERQEEYKFNIRLKVPIMSKMFFFAHLILHFT